jgi:hypothetical protein
MRKRENEIQKYRKLRHDSLQRQLTELGISFRQLNEKDWTFVRSEIIAFLNQNDSISLKEEWHIHARLVQIRMELEKRIRKEKLMVAIKSTGFTIEVLPPCGERFVETGVMTRCSSTSICTQQQPFLGAISPELLDDFQSGGNSIECIAKHIVNQQRAIEKIDSMIESTLFRQLQGREYSVDFLRRWVKQILQKQIPKSVDSAMLASIVSMVCKKYVQAQKTQQEEELAFSSRMLQVLELSIQNKCPLISKKLLPLRMRLEDPTIKEMVQNFCSATHRYCTKHLTVCLEYAVSDLASTFRQNESQKYLIRELKKLMPDFENKDLLVSKGSRERFDSATRLGMWMHIPINAMRIYREECLTKRLLQVDPAFSHLELLERSKQVFRQFILSNSHLIPQSDSSVWPANAELMDCVNQIRKDEAHKRARTAIGKSILKGLNLNMKDDLKIQFLVLYILM